MSHDREIALQVCYRTCGSPRPQFYFLLVSRKFLRREIRSCRKQRTQAYSATIFVGRRTEGNGKVAHLSKTGTSDSTHHFTMTPNKIRPPRSCKTPSMVKFYVSKFDDLTIRTYGKAWRCSSRLNLRRGDCARLSCFPAPGKMSTAVIRSVCGTHTG